MYWSKQIELAEQHKKEATIFFKHFYKGYLQDKALDNDVERDFYKVHRHLTPFNKNDVDTW